VDEVEHLTAVRRDGLHLRQRAPRGGWVRPVAGTPTAVATASPAKSVRLRHSSHFLLRILFQKRRLRCAGLRRLARTLSARQERLRALPLWLRSHRQSTSPGSVLPGTSLSLESDLMGFGCGMLFYSDLREGNPIQSNPIQLLP